MEAGGSGHLVDGSVASDGGSDQIGSGGSPSDIVLPAGPASSRAHLLALADGLLHVAGLERKG
jgi:hypothetical protein